MSSARIAVCMFDNELVRGGAEEHILGLLSRLNRDCFRPLLVCPQDLLDLLRPDLPHDVEVLPLSIQSHCQLSRMKTLYSFLRQQRVQILHSHGFRASLIASPVGRSAGVPATIETPHIREYWRQGWKASFVVDRVASRFIDQYIAVSDANRKYLTDEKGLPAGKVALIRNGCDTLRFDSAHRPPAKLKRGLSIQDDAPVLLLVGRLEPQKGHSVLLQAMVLLQGEFPNLTLVALGEGSLRSELEARVCELGLRNFVRLPGHLPDTRDWMAAADVCVLPSFAEGLPLFAIECLAAGRPIVASAVDGTPEIVVDGCTGLTVPPGNAVALAHAITRLLRDRKFAAQLGNAGAKWVNQWFTLERQISETEGLYKRLWQLKTGNAPPLPRQSNAEVTVSCNE